MESPEDLCNIEDDGDARKATACTSSTSSGSPGESAYRGTIHSFMGGGQGKKKKKDFWLTLFHFDMLKLRPLHLGFMIYSGFKMKGIFDYF